MAERARVESLGLQRVEEDPHSVRAGQADERVVRQLPRRLPHLRLVGALLDPDRRQLDDLGPEAAQLAARPLACARARVTTTIRPCSGRRASQSSASRRARDLADHDQRRRLHLGCLRRLRDSREVRGHRPLARHRPALHDSRRRLRRPAAVDQRPRDLRQPPDAHVEDQRPREARQRLPVQRRLALLRILVAGDEGDRRRVVAMGDRDARVGARRDTRRHPGHGLELDRRRHAAPRPPRRRGRRRRGRRPSGAARCGPRGRRRSSARRSPPAPPTARPAACRRRRARRPPARRRALRAGSGGHRR